MERAKKKKAEREAKEKARKAAEERAKKKEAERFAKEKADREKTRNFAIKKAKKLKDKREAEAEAKAKTEASRQGTKTANERNAEEKAFFESPIKDMHRRGRVEIRQLADTDTGKYSLILSESEKDILWREKQDEKVYEGMKADKDRKAYAVEVKTEWDGFTGGKISIPNLTKYDSIGTSRISKEISPTNVILAKDVPGAVAGVALGLPLNALAPWIGVPLQVATSVAGSKIGDALNPSLISEGPAETMEIVARWDEQDVTIIYTATKYSEGGMDMQTTYKADGVVEPVITWDYYPYDSFKEE